MSSIVSADWSQPNSGKRRRAADEPLAAAEHGDIAPPPTAHSVLLAAWPDHHVPTFGESPPDRLPRGGDDPGRAEVVAEPGQREQDVMGGAVQHPLALEMPL